MTRLLAPAKLTLSLAVTGVRSDGYHQLRSEMVSLSLADELTFTEGGTGLTLVAEPGTRAESLARTGTTSSRAPWRRWGGGPPCTCASGFPWAAAWAADRPTPRRSCAGPVHRPRRGAGAGVRRPFSVVGGRALVEGTGETVTPLDFEPRTFLLVLPPFGVDTGEGLCGLGRAGGTAASRERGQCADRGGAGGRAETGPVA
jgi:4-diphosphocytidyl-2-C-methyl-D-erythritol kinase